MELRGHSLGHYLSACALMAEATGDDRLRQRALTIVAELRKVQLDDSPGENLKTLAFRAGAPDEGPSTRSSCDPCRTALPHAAAS